MKTILISCILLFNILQAQDNHEINIKFGSYLKHHSKVFDFNEGWKNRAKGIEYLYKVDKKNHLGLTYLNYKNSFNKKTIVKGFVYRYSLDPMIFSITPNMKLYYVKQKGYYGSWDNPNPYASYSGESNEFWTPLISTGITWNDSTIDMVGSVDTFHA